MTFLYLNQNSMTFTWLSGKIFKFPDFSLTGKTSLFFSASGNLYLTDILPRQTVFKHNKRTFYSEISHELDKSKQHNSLNEDCYAN